MKMRSEFPRTVLVLASLAMVAHADAREGTGDDSMQIALTACQGRQPPPLVCNTVHCNGGDAAWEYLPVAAGTVCQSIGHCDGTGTCIVPQPISPPPIISNMRQNDATSIAFELQCAPQAINHRIMRSINGWPFSEIGFTTIPARPPCSYPQGTCPGDDPCWGPHPAVQTIADVWDVRAGDQMCYYVVGWNEVYSGATPNVCITIPLDYTVPTLPTAQVNRGIGTAEIVFTDQSINETRFRLFSRTAGSGDWVLQKQWDRVTLGGDRSTGQQFSYTLSGLDPNVSYEAKIEVYHDRAEVSAELVLPAFRPKPPIPAAPSNLRVVTKTDKTVTLSWDTTAYAVTYNVRFSAANGLPDTSPTRNYGDPIATIVTSPTIINRCGSCGGGTSGNDPLLSSTNYCFIVQGNDESGSGPYSNQACVTTYANAPVSRVIDLQMNAQTQPSGRVINFANFSIVDGTLDFFELRSEDNDPRLAGIIVSPNNSIEYCNLNVPGAFFMDRDGVLNGADVQVLYGSQHPVLTDTINIHGCPIYSSFPTPAPALSLKVHYTGP